MATCQPVLQALECPSLARSRLPGMAWDKSTSTATVSRKGAMTSRSPRSSLGSREVTSKWMRALDSSAHSHQPGPGHRGHLRVPSALPTGTLCPETACLPHTPQSLSQCPRIPHSQHRADLSPFIHLHLLGTSREKSYNGQKDLKKKKIDVSPHYKSKSSKTSHHTLKGENAQSYYALQSPTLSGVEVHRSGDFNVS